MNSLKLTDSTTTLDLFADRYDIYISGGRNVSANSFKIRLANKSTGETIPVLEHDLKFQDFNGVRYYYFDIAKNGSYDISFTNYNSLVVKKSMLPILSLLQSKIDPSDIRIIIERKHR